MSECKTALRAVRKEKSVLVTTLMRSYDNFYECLSLTVIGFDKKLFQPKVKATAYTLWTANIE